MDIRREIAAALGQPVVDIEPLGGGCVSAVYAVRAAGGERLVVKVDETGKAGLPVEAMMLRYLAERTALPVPAVGFVSEWLLVMQYVAGGSQFNDGAERHAAELLAELHAITAPHFGFDGETRIGSLRQPNPPATSWVAFFAEHRLVYMATEAAVAGRLPGGLAGRVERLAAGVGQWLTEPAQPSLIHGDVWATNVLARGGRVVAFLDPALYFADPEIELAFIGLFGTFGRAFYEQYNALRPIAPGFFERRRDLYNLYPLLVHTRLFGGSYVGQVERTVSRYGY